MNAIGRALDPRWASTLAAAAIGAASWGANLAQLALAPLVVVLWASRRSRSAAWLAMLAYYLAAARGLPAGAAYFFGNHTPALFSVTLWLAASVVLSTPWGLAWGRSGLWWRLPLALALCIVPPVGLVGWAHPLTAAGVFLPGSGWAGLVAMTAALVAWCRWPTRLTVLLGSLALTTSLMSLPPAPEDWIESQNTSYGGAGAVGRDFARDYLANQDLIGRAERASQPFVVFPEGVAGVWSQETSELWADTAVQLAHQGRTVLVGAELPLAGSARTRNALVMLGAESGELVQRIPVPVSMWRPWSESGTLADPFGDGIARINGRRVAVFICYEQLLVWPMLLSQAARPQLMIGAANLYWAAGTSIPGIQSTGLRAWSRLFGVPLVMAINR